MGFQFTKIKIIFYQGRSTRKSGKFEHPVIWLYWNHFTEHRLICALTFSRKVLFHLQASLVLEPFVRPSVPATWTLKSNAATWLQTSPRLQEKESLPFRITKDLTAFTTSNILIDFLTLPCTYSEHNTLSRFFSYSTPKLRVACSLPAVRGWLWLSRNSRETRRWWSYEKQVGHVQRWKSRRLRAICKLSLILLWMAQGSQSGKRTHLRMSRLASVLGPRSIHPQDRTDQVVACYRHCI